MSLPVCVEYSKNAPHDIPEENAHWRRQGEMEGAMSSIHPARQPDEQHEKDHAKLDGDVPKRCDDVAKKSDDINKKSDDVAKKSDDVTNKNDVPVKDMADGVDVFGKQAYKPLLSSNQYQVRKLAAQALMDVALMMANISQLRTLIALGPEKSQQFYLMVVLVAASLVCQLTFAILMFGILIRESDQQQKRDYLDTVTMLQESGNLSLRTKAKVSESIVREMNEFKHDRVTGHLNYVTMVLVFLITVINMFITGFGIHDRE